jgi:hypothetical protein
MIGLTTVDVTDNISITGNSVISGSLFVKHSVNFRIKTYN